MTASKRTPVAVGAFLAAWEALCGAVGRHSLTAGQASSERATGRCAALELTLAALGYPEALASGARLGAALRRLWGLRDEQGRYLERSRGAKGSIWYVVTPTAAAGWTYDGPRRDARQDPRQLDVGPTAPAGAGPAPLDLAAIEARACALGYQGGAAGALLEDVGALVAEVWRLRADRAVLARAESDEALVAAWEERS